MGNKKVMMIAILTMYVFILGACGSQKETDSTFSSFYISDTEWTTVGDCQMMDGADSIKGAYSYKIKK